MSQMDIAGGIHAVEVAGGRVATVAVDWMDVSFASICRDVVSCYCKTERVGNTSIAVRVEAWVRRRFTGTTERVTVGLFTFVAIDESRKPRPIVHSSES